MASTNKTTHYELSQYIGTDKPTYLTDYNQDMAKIDAGIYGADGKATTNATNIGDLTNLTTTTKSSLVGAINEIDGDIGDVTSLTTTDKSDIVSAINEVNSEATGVGDITNLTTTDKSSVVGAVNEVNGKVGNLTNLNTTNKNNLVSATNEVNNNIGNISSLAGGESDTVTAINNVKSNLTSLTNVVAGIDGAVLWTNPNPNSSFVGQTITLSNMDYDEYEIVYKQSTTNANTETKRTLKGYGSRLSVSFAGNEGVNIESRAVSYVSATSLTFDDAYVSVGAGHRTQDNTLIIPLYVIGYKSNLFS